MNKRPHKILLSLVVSSILLFTAPFIAQAMLYTPGATLDPTCAPTDSNCGIATTTPVNTGTQNQIPYYATAGTQLTGTSTLTILPNGNIGIGTTTPFAPFSVVGQIVGSYFTSLSKTVASTFTYASSTSITVSGTSFLNKIFAPTLTGTTTNSGAISGGTISGTTLTSTTTNTGTITGGTVTSHITQHCATITDGNWVGTVTPTNSPPSGGGFSISNYTKINLNTTLLNSDNAADPTNSQIKVPAWAGHVQVFGHMDFPEQNNGNGWAGVHLFRDNSYTAEAYYHTQIYYPASTSTAAWAGNVSAVAISPVIPVLGLNETWQLYAEQSTGANIKSTGPGSWLTVCFYP